MNSSQVVSRIPTNHENYIIRTSCWWSSARKAYVATVCTVKQNGDLEMSPLISSEIKVDVIIDTAGRFSQKHFDSVVELLEKKEFKAVNEATENMIEYLKTNKPKF